MQVDIKDPVIKAIIEDMSKMAFKIENLENQVAAIGIDKMVAADAAPGPEPEPDDLPGPTDLDEFKPKGFEGSAAGAPPVDKTPDEIKKKAKELFDGIELTEDQVAELEEEDETEDEFDVDDDTNED